MASRTLHLWRHGHCSFVHFPIMIKSPWIFFCSCYLLQQKYQVYICSKVFGGKFVVTIFFNWFIIIIIIRCRLLWEGWLPIFSKSHEVFVSHSRPFCDVCHPLRSWPSSASFSLQIVCFLFHSWMTYILTKYEKYTLHQLFDSISHFGLSWLMSIGMLHRKHLKWSWLWCSTNVTDITSAFIN